MSRKGKKSDDPVSRERLAHLGLAADRAGSGQSCPGDDHFAEMLDGEAGSAVQRSFFQHLAHCESCFQKWLVLSEALDGYPGKTAGAVPWFRRRPVLAGVGSACGLALVMMLYLAIDYRPVSYDEGGQQQDDRVSIYVSSAGPDERVREEAGPERSERLESRQWSPPADSEPGREAGMVQEQDEAPKTAEPSPVALKTAPDARRQKQATDAAAGSVAHEKMMPRSELADKDAAASIETGNNLSMEVKRLSPAAARKVDHNFSEYRDFVNRVADLCSSGSGGLTAADTDQLLREAGKLLKTEALPAGESRTFVEYVVNEFQQEESIGDEERAEFCEKARTVIMEEEQSGDKP